MSIRKTPAGSLVDQAEKGQDPGPPSQPEHDEGDIATPEWQAPTEDDKPLE
jgi:hypothetical protein